MCNEIIQFVDAKEQVRLPNLSTCALNVRGVRLFSCFNSIYSKIIDILLKLLLLLIIVLIIIKLKVSFR